MKTLVKKCLDYLAMQIVSRLGISSLDLSADLQLEDLPEYSYSKDMAEILTKLDQNKTLTNFLIEGIYPSNLVIEQNGRRIFLDPRDPYITVHYLQHQSWEPQVTDVMAKVFNAHKSHQTLLNSRVVFIDCGANIGLHSLKAAEIGYEVLLSSQIPLPLNS